MQLYHSEREITIHRAVYEKFKDGTVKDISDELPFKIPATWRCVRFGDVTLNRDAERIPLSKEQRSRLAKNFDYYGASGIIDKVDKYLFDKPLLLVGEDGANLLARSTPIAFIASGKYWVNNHAHVIDSIEFDLLKYLETFINAISLTPYITGTAQPKMNQEKMNDILVALPTLAEQKRIVAKIEKLMPLVEEYGKLEETRLQLDADLPSALEKSILQEAIQGKLVPQDPKDEPASELLKRIAAERKVLVKAGKLKRDKGESVIFRGSDRLAYETRNGETVCIQDEIPFEIPDSWEWVRLGSVCSIVRGSGIKRSETTDSGSPCIRYGEIYTTYGYSFQVAKSFTSESVVAKCHKAHSGDVLCTLTGECKEEIAKATAYLGTEAIAIGGDLARISNHPYNPMLLVYFMFSPFMLSQKADKSNGDIIVHIGKEAIEDLLIPLPPRSEQERIVAKVANLLSGMQSFTT